MIKFGVSPSAGQGFYFIVTVMFLKGNPVLPQFFFEIVGHTGPFRMFGHRPMN